MGELLMHTGRAHWYAAATVSVVAAVTVWAVLTKADGRPTVEAPRRASKAVPSQTLSLVDDIHPTLEVHTGYNQNLHRYVVEFLVGNQSDAGNSIERFGVASIGRPLAVRNPAQWQGFYGVFGRDSALVWTCWDTLTPPPANYAGMNTYKGPYVIDPGDTLHRFQMFLDYLPASFRYYAWGYDTIPDGTGQWQNPFTVGWTGSVMLDVTAVRSGLPKAVEFMAPKPNPTSSGTSITFALPRDSKVALKIYDVRGAQVRDLVSGERRAGINVATWDGSTDQGKPCRAGNYYARLSIDGRAVGVKRITILR